MRRITSINCAGHRLLTLISVAPVLVVLAAIGLFSNLAAATQNRLETGTVEIRQIAQEQVFDGAIEAVLRSTISAQTAGEIIELPFDVNDFVPKGAVIVRFDDTKQTARLNKAAATEAEARARLAEAEETFNREPGTTARGARIAIDSGAFGSRHALVNIICPTAWSFSIASSETIGFALSSPMRSLTSFASSSEANAHALQTTHYQDQPLKLPELASLISIRSLFLITRIIR